jgi:pimeloyl-ACP methyl ester carboxylesterase
MLVTAIDPNRAAGGTGWGMAWARVSLPDGDDVELEVDVRGAGEPVVLIQTAVTADELVPLARQPQLRDAFQVVLYHRRGYGASSPVVGPGSIERDATDCRRLLRVLGVDRAHVVGVSYSAAVAMQLAATEPQLVQTLCLVEPPPLHTLRADEFRAANEDLVADHQRHGASVALDNFLRRVVGEDWRADIASHLPDGVAQVERDADTFFVTDLPALLGWRFGGEDARRIGRPVLYLGGTDSGPWFAEVHDLVMDWFPDAQHRLLTGADHSLALTHAPEAAAELASFLRRHPIDG